MGYSFFGDTSALNLCVHACVSVCVCVCMAECVCVSVQNTAACCRYPGCDRSMLVPNCIFRANGAAILLSNKSKDARRSKYELQHVVRTTISNDEAYGCVYQTEDDKGEGIRGAEAAPQGRAVCK